MNTQSASRRDASPNQVAVDICTVGGARVPEYTRPEDAAVDLQATISTILEPGARALIPTGIRLAIPSGFAGLVLPRSGLAINHGLTILNAPGLIDENYRGEVKVALYNSSSEAFPVNEGDRIAQLLVMPVLRISFREVRKLDDTDRGSAGFGSSGI